MVIFIVFGDNMTSVANWLTSRSESIPAGMDGCPKDIVIYTQTIVLVISNLFTSVIIEVSSYNGSLLSSNTH